MNEFESSVDTVIMGDYNNSDWSYTLFLGHDFDSEKGKELFYKARTESNSLGKLISIIFRFSINIGFHQTHLNMESEPSNN
ncbi:hypothetical protein [Daejeonella sp.]|jgi:hypothetical protein|uniref:hypothetical protein n=1 Tax=Daejeonella sp. TaxID=2805397 RepID=UPI0037BEE1E8